MAAKCVMALVLLMASSALAAQDLEPRRWTHLPVGTNTVAIGYAGQSADIYLEPKATRRPWLGKSSEASGTRRAVRSFHAVERSRLPPKAGAGKRDSFNPMIGITDGTADLNAWLARYSYSFSWFGKTARLDGILPYVSGTWQGLVDGEPGQRTIRAGGDPWLRLSVNFFGSPALRGQEFLDFLTQNPTRTTVGASLAVSLPWGACDPEEFINVGRNRYTLRPQLGVLHQRGPWSFELTGSVFMFSDNDEFVESISLSQYPVFALQAHITRTFKRNFWLGTGVAYAAGGDVKLDHARTTYEVDNLLWSLVGSYRISKHQSVMLAWQLGRTQVDVGSDTESWLLSWSVAWGH